MPATTPDRSPTVSVIVPARNEERCLARCLDSLLAQEGVDFELIVVDDGSADTTGAIARSRPRVRLLQAAPWRDGLSGKCNAAQTGANAARGEWLLFTDADTVHLPGSLARALAEARELGATLLSYSPAQEAHSFCEKVALPLIFAELAVTYRPAEVNDPASPVAAANGQYLLITREAYDAAGGHAAVSHTLLEDVALAQAVKSSGRRLRFRFGGDAVRSRMYSNFHDLREGWTKNLALLFPGTGRLAVRRATEFLLTGGGIAAAAVGAAMMNYTLLAAGLAVALPT